MPSDRATSSARLVLRIVKADRRQGRVNTPRSRARYPRLLHRLAHVVDPLRPCRTSRWSYIGMAEQLLHHGQIVGLVQRAHAGGEAKARALKAAFVQVGSLFERRPHRYYDAASPFMHRSSRLRPLRELRLAFLVQTAVG